VVAYHVIKYHTYSCVYLYIRRTLITDIVTYYRERIQRLERDVKDIERMELEEKELRVTELKVNKAESLIKHHDEIMSRPKRTWFQSHQERKLDEGLCRFYACLFV